MVTKKEFEKMMASLDDRIEKRLESLGEKFGSKIDSLEKKIDLQGSKLDAFVERISDLEVRIDNLETSLETTEKQLPELQRTCQELNDKLTSFDLATRRNNIIVTTSNQSNTSPTYVQLLNTLAATQMKMPTPLSSLLLRNKRGDSIGLRLNFSSLEDRNTIANLINKTGKDKGIYYRDDLPAELTKLKNELLIERRQLLSTGTGCYIKTSLKPPFLTLIHSKSRKTI